MKNVHPKRFEVLAVIGYAEKYECLSNEVSQWGGCKLSLLAA